MNLRQAVKIVNTHNRPGGAQLVGISKCDNCKELHARQIQDIRLAESRGHATICPRPECRKAHARQRRKSS